MATRISGVYKITCTTNGRFYIGSSNNIHVRWNTHKKTLRRGKHHSTHMQRCWDKYGEELFVFEIIETVTSQITSDREQYWLDTLKPFGKRGFNTNRKANAGKNKGYKHTLETRAKISATHFGIKPNDEARAKQSAAKKGIPRKTYIFTSPSGDVFKVDGLVSFCAENGLRLSHISSVATGKRLQHKGWKCQYVEGL